MEHPSSAPRSPRSLLSGIIALALSLLLLAAIDVGLRVAGFVPPQDPLLFYAQTFSSEFTPFVRDGEFVSIRPDWIATGDGLRSKPGSREGRFFLLPGFRPCRFAKEKPPGTTRLFVLGDSTVFGLFVGAQQAFAGVLERELRARTPNRAFEVINLGCPGWASPRAANVLPQVLDFDPDAIIVYVGHNEMLAGHSGATAQLDDAARWRASLISVSSIAAWMNWGVAQFRRGSDYDLVKEEATALQLGEVPAYDPLDVPIESQRLPDPASLSRADEDYARNLRSMVDQCRDAGVPILFVLPIANVMMPPAVSAHAQGFARAAEFDSLLEGARLEIEAGRQEEGLSRFDRALELSPSFALAHFRRGKTLLRLGRTEEAKASLQAACDLDVRTHRITSRLEGVLVRTAEQEGAPWVDLRPLFRHGLSVETAPRYFRDHCHPTEEGHRMIAGRILDALASLAHHES